jgi:hypothetical protein
MGISHGRTEQVRYAIVDENNKNDKGEYETKYMRYDKDTDTYKLEPSIADATLYSIKRVAACVLEDYIMLNNDKDGVSLATVYMVLDFEHESGHW